ncbi:MAG: cell division protein FtsA [Polyangiales bacterium]|nr:cell division protein FtsA [Myxococcales bacterium]MCB9657006.1 cell division protein FtsA [Sandaracinaceae bacterium]
MAASEIIAGLDLGTTKVTVIVAELTDDGLDVIGIGSVPAKGLKKGVVVNIESTVQAIRAAVEQAEAMAGVEINTVFAGIAGSHVSGMNEEGVAAIGSREVTQDDVDRVLIQAKAVPLPGDREVIHVLPQEYIVDAQDGIKEPVGMAGVRLEARVHMVTAASSCVANIVKCAERCGLHVAEVVLQPLASAHAVLSDDEKEIGAVLIDIGGGTSDIIVYVDGAVVHTSSIPIGGINLTNDVATGLRTPMAEAERIKIKYGCAATFMIDEDEVIEVPSVGGRAPRTLSRRALCDIIEPRVEEIFVACRHVIAETGYADMLASGAIITGGTTLLDGMPELAEQVLGLPVRRAAPIGIGGLIDVVKSPAYSTGVGLVKYGVNRLQTLPVEEEIIHVPQGTGLGGRISAWFREVF